MKNGILRDDEGYDLLVHGADRTFSATKDGAYEVARELKRRNGVCIVEIRDRSNGLGRGNIRSREQRFS
jgi:ribosome biogenesis protein Nip4